VTPFDSPVTLIRRCGEDLANFGCRPDVKVEGFDKLGQFSKQKSFAYVEIIFFRLRKMQTSPHPQ
jgi:hypothetical protein